MGTRTRKAILLLLALFQDVFTGLARHATDRTTIVALQRVYINSRQPTAWTSNTADRIDEHDKLQLSSRQPTDRATQATLHAGQPRQVPTTARSRRIDIRTPTLQGKHQARRDRPSCNQPTRWRHRYQPCKASIKLDATDQVATNRHAGDIGTNHARQASSSTRPTMQVATNRLKLDATDQVATNRHAGDIGTNHARQASSSTRPTMQVATNRLAGDIDSTCQATLVRML